MESSEAPTRSARVLLGWMPANAAVAPCAGQRREELARPEFAQRAEQARRAAAMRRRTVGADGVVIEPPPALQAYQPTLLEKQPRLVRYFERGLRLALVDLRRVCALQSGVFTDLDVPDFDLEDVAAFCAFTLRPPPEQALPLQYDSARKAWSILTSDRNVRIVRQFRTELEGGALGVGFEIRQFGSALQVLHYRDRFVLVDGYHRAVALLARGISVAPALVGAIDSPEELADLAVGIGLEVVLGNGPPLLPDFLDDEVAAEVKLPAVTRLLIVEAMDVRAFG
jgi:hypothetical protein